MKKRDLLTTVPVTLLINDKNFLLNHNEIDTSQIVILNSLPSPAESPLSLIPPNNLGSSTVSHGTGIASILISKENGNLISGYAKSITNEINTLIYDDAYYNPTYDDYSRVIVDIFQAVETIGLFCNTIGGCINTFQPVINMSRYLGITEKKKCDSFFKKVISAVNLIFKKYLELYPNTIIVTGMPNGSKTSFSMERDCFSPAGLPDIPNLITVGGTNSYINDEGLCETHERVGVHDIIMPDSYPAPEITVYAPARNIPLLDLTPANGNSYAVPQVTSLVLILKSINPELTPQQIKYLIQNYSIPDENNEWCAISPQSCYSGWSDLDNAAFPVLSMYYPVMKAIIDKYDCKNNPDKEICKIVLPNHKYHPDFPDPSSHVLNRICGGLNLYSSTFGDFSISSCSMDPFNTDPEDICTENFASGGVDAVNNTVSISANTYEVSLVLRCASNDVFHLTSINDFYPIIEDNSLDPSCFISFSKDEKPYQRKSGKLHFDNCIINSYLNSYPSSITVWGTFTSSLIDPQEQPSVSTYPLAGEFAVEFFVNTAMYSNPDFLQYLLDTCEN
ncbi:S8/S53 family peptidase [Myxococcota bacterium]|nr:S8/S53 family peptidase [Myxococcota bacterium]MBU1381570.1 S8/S53 family peptidase [Myxococcota bacterium]MBU1496066.1 S8/S53 family peptidase [Myxococcota bacterium]